MAEPCHLADLICISQVMGWLVCFWLRCECGVQSDHTSLRHRALRQVLVCD